MKKILVVGNTESIFVKDFCEKISSSISVVDVLTIDGCTQLPSVRKTFFAKITTNLSRGKYHRFVNLQVDLAKTIKCLDTDYDCVVIHSVDARLSIHIKKLTKISRRLVTVVWGSDFYRTSKLLRFFQKNIYKKSDAIIFTNPLTIVDFKRSLPKVSRKPLLVARFGLPALDEIKIIRRLNISRSNMCKFFDLPDNKIIILAGYNSNLAHQQGLIINEFSKLEEELKNKAILVFPLGYGDTASATKIKFLLQENKLENYKILDKFYNFADIAKLRCITDLLINIQPTDQFSGSMQETLFAGGRVLAGRWLPYGEIIAKGAAIKPISSLDDLGEALKSEIRIGMVNACFGSNELCSYIDGTSSWGANIKIWERVMFEDYATNAG